METVGVRELRQNASALLERIQATGVSIEITNHGHPVARLVPIPRQAQSSRAQLIDAGVLRPGRGEILDIAPMPAPPGAPSTAELLAADREDRWATLAERTNVMLAPKARSGRRPALGAGRRFGERRLRSGHCSVSIYFDTSALAKLIITEDESKALREWIGARPGIARITNVVGVVELQRLAARVGQSALSSAVQLLVRIDQLDMTPIALMRAAQLPPPEVRTLDALHNASASELTDLEAMVTYDLRMISAANNYGLPVASPGIA
jgi:prevent-host-death family protein